MNSNITQRYLLRFRSTLLLFVLAANILLYSLGISYSWALFISNIMLFASEDNLKKRYLSVEIGGFTGLVLGSVLMLCIYFLSPFLGRVAGFALPITIILFALIVLQPSFPYVFNSTAFVYMSCACIAPTSFFENIGSIFLLYLLASPIYNGICCKMLFSCLNKIANQSVD